MRFSTMKLFILAVLFVLSLAPQGVEAEPYKPDPGPYEVESFTADWEDTLRDRTVPVLVYMPADAEGERPVVIVSHGLGGTREGLAYLGNHWASHGYICIHMQHHGSDDAIWRDVPARQRVRALRRASSDWRAGRARLRDVPFVLDTLETAQHDDDSPLHGKLDLDHIAIAGHSYGAWTSMMLAGQTGGLSNRVSYRDERIDVAIPLSSPTPRDENCHNEVYSHVEIPVLHLTGTLDESPVNDGTAEQRRVPFDHTTGRDAGRNAGNAAQYLIIFEGGDHMVLGGPPAQGERNRMMERMRERAGVDLDHDPIIHRLILQATTAFLDGWLMNDKDAIAWLDDGGLEETLDEDGTVESK